MWRLAPAFVLTALTAACSALVGEPPSTLFCEPGSGEGVCPPGQACVCPPGQRCACATCVPASEVCNGRDDDCDGSVDEGLNVDEDGDGFYACDQANPSRQDCDDANTDIYPGRPEICNGLDDDCDPSTTEADGCPEGQVCYRQPSEPAPACFALADCRTSGGRVCGSGTYCAEDGRCAEIPRMGCVPGTRDPSCPPGSFCDARGECVPLRRLGEPCRTAFECQSGLCFEGRFFGSSFPSRFCGVSCCTDADCEPGHRCLAPGTGARSCVPASMVSHAPTCAHDGDCGGGLPCRATGPRNASRTECAVRDSQWDGLCANDSDCRSNVCDPWGCLLGVCGGECSRTCRTSAECRGDEGCAYTSRWPTLPHCVPREGSGRTGDACDRSARCADRRCWLGVCADACCVDAHCPTGHRCTVIDANGPEMRCIPIAVE